LGDAQTSLGQYYLNDYFKVKNLSFNLGDSDTERTAKVRKMFE
jgi:hypothetical protein